MHTTVMVTVDDTTSIGLESELGHAVILRSGGDSIHIGFTDPLIATAVGRAVLRLALEWDSCGHPGCYDEHGHTDGCIMAWEPA